MKICSVDWCGKPHYGKGFCRAHYMRLRNHGDPLGGRTPPGELMRFIREVVLKHTSSECLTWPFGTDAAGYGRVHIDGKQHVVSRYVCEFVNGPPPTPKHDAAHACGNGHEACIAPAHLSWKTRAENMADTLIHGTHNRGERQGSSKLTEHQVHEIRRLKGSLTISEIGRLFGIDQSHVSAVQRRKAWAWLRS